MNEFLSVGWGGNPRGGGGELGGGGGNSHKKKLGMVIVSLRSIGHLGRNTTILSCQSIF